MAQVIQTLCDVHLNGEDEQQLIGRTFVINVNGRSRVVELCSICEDQLLVPLLDVLNEHGRKADAADMPAPVRESRTPRAGSTAASCPIEGETFKSRAGLAIHARHKHEMSVEALLGEAPNLGMMLCTFPDCGAKSVSRGAVATHVLNKHELTLNELEQLYGPVRPSLDNNTPSTGPGDQYICLDCDPPRKFNMAAGLHSHRRNRHKVGAAA